MRRKYLQEKYRTSGKRFHPELNKMSSKGWTVEDMHHMDDGVVLVTYSRPYPTRVVQGVYPYDVYETKHQQLTEQGYRLLSALPAGTVIDEDETLIVVFASWEIDIID